MTDTALINPLPQNSGGHKKAKKRRRFSMKRQYLAFPYFVLSALFVVIPLIILLVYAFRDADGNFTFSNFGAFFTDSMVLKNLGNSVLIALCTTAFCLLFAYPIALILANSRFNKTMILVVLFILPMYINSLIRTVALRSVLDWIKLNNTFFRIVIAHVFDFFPFMLLPIYTVLVNMDKSYLEASNDLGAGDGKTFLKVTLPLSVPGIVSGILMVFMPTVSMYAIRETVAGNEEWKMFGKNIDDLFFKNFDYGKGSAYSFILLVMVMITMLISGLINAKRRGGAAGK